MTKNISRRKLLASFGMAGAALVMNNLLPDKANASAEISTVPVQREINMMEYGAKGDGVTNDTAAIQNALTIAETQGSVRIYFPPGTYLTSAYLRLYANTTIEFHPGAVIKRTGTVNKVFINGEQGHASYAVGYNGEGNIHIIGGTIDLNSGSGASASTTISAFDLGHGENISFTGLTITHGQIGHYFQVSGCRNVRFKDCWFGNVQRTSTASNNYELLQIEPITNNTFPTFGSSDYTPSKDIYIENCVFDTVIRAIGTHGTVVDGGGNTVYCENIQIRNCTFRSSYENMLNMYSYKGVVLENNTISNCGENGVWMSDVHYSHFKNNTIRTANETGFFINLSNGNRFAKNNIFDVGLRNGFSAIRVTDSDNNTFDDDTVYSAAPSYTYAYYSSGGSVGNKLLTYNFTAGVSNTIGGSDAVEITNIIIGGGQTVLFNGDLGAVGAAGALSADIRGFSLLVICGNDNSSPTAQMVTMFIPKPLYITGVASRFRLVPDDTTNSVDRIDFGFPTPTSIQVDALSGTCHIRQVIGVI